MAVIPEWARVVNTTTQQFIREEEVNTLRNDKLLIQMEQAGRITFNHSGRFMDWKIRYKNVPVVGYADMDTQNFQRHNLHKTAQLEWRGYSSTDAISKKERLMNKGREAIIRIWENKATDLMDSINRHFSDELYIDGNAAGNTKRLHGIESFLGDDGATVVGDKTATPSDNYAGLSTVEAAFGGVWSGVWPVGTGDEEYDFWTPILVNWASDAWAGATNDFKDNALEHTRFGIIHSQRNRGRDSSLDTICYGRDLYILFLEKIQTEERIWVQRAESPLVRLGFKDVVNFDGTDVTWEYPCPENTGYGYNINQMELRSLQGQLFMNEGPFYDEASKTWRFSIDFFGNMRFNPRYFVKWFNFAGA